MVSAIRNTTVRRRRVPITPESLALLPKRSARVPEDYKVVFKFIIKSIREKTMLFAAIFLRPKPVVFYRQHRPRSLFAGVPAIMTALSELTNALKTTLNATRPRASIPRAMKK